MPIVVASLRRRWFPGERGTPTSVSTRQRFGRLEGTRTTCNWYTSTYVGLSAGFDQSALANPNSMEWGDNLWFYPELRAHKFWHAQHCAGMVPGRESDSLPAPPSAPQTVGGPADAFARPFVKRARVVVGVGAGFRALLVSGPRT